MVHCKIIFVLFNNFAVKHMKIIINADYIEQLRKEYNSYGEVAKKLGVSTRTLFNYRKKSSIKNDFDQNYKFSLKNIEDKLKKESLYSVSKELGMNEESLKRYIEVLKLNHKYAKNEQKYRDITNVKGKHFREYTRIDNCLEELSSSIFNTLKNTKFNNIDKIKRNKKIDNDEYVGVVHWSDLHFNEYVNIESNQFNLDIASKRLKKHVY